MMNPKEVEWNQYLPKLFEDLGMVVLDYSSST